MHKNVTGHIILVEMRERSFMKNFFFRTLTLSKILFYKPIDKHVGNCNIGEGNSNNFILCSDNRKKHDSSAKPGPGLQEHVGISHSPTDMQKPHTSGCGCDPGLFLNNHRGEMNS